MKSIFNNFNLIIFCLLVGCATTPVSQQKPYIDQAIWNKVAKGKVYDACLTALTMANIAVHPLGINKESGIIVTEARKRHIDFRGKTTIWHYTLQISVFEKQDNKVMVTLTAVNAGYNGNPPGPEMTDMRRYFNESIANDAEKFFNQLDALLGKAEYYRPGKALFPL